MPDLTRIDVRYLRSLSQKKVRQAEGKFLLEGWRTLREALAAGVCIDYVVVDVNQADRNELGALTRRGVAVKHARGQDLEKIADTVHSQGVVALVRQKRYTLDDVLRPNASLIVAADALTDPGNLGTILRTCDWFGVDGVLLGAGSVELHNEKVVRASAGSIFHLPVAEDVDLVAAIERARGAGFRTLVAAGDAGVDYSDCDFGKKSLLVLGSEGHGVAPAVRGAADSAVRVPKYGSVESLNVGVACGIILAQMRTNKN